MSSTVRLGTAALHFMHRPPNLAISGYRGRFWTAFPWPPLQAPRHVAYNDRREAEMIAKFVVTALIATILERSPPRRN